MGSSSYPSPKSYAKTNLYRSHPSKKMKLISGLYYDEPFVFCCAFGDTEQAKKIWMAHISRYDHNQDELLDYSYSLAEANKHQETMEWLRSLGAPQASRNTCYCIMQHSQKIWNCWVGPSAQKKVCNTTLFSFTEAYDDDSYNVSLSICLKLLTTH